MKNLSDLLAIGGGVTALLASSLFIVPALAIPGLGFQPSPIMSAHLDALDVKAEKVEKWDLFLKTKDDTDVGPDRLTVQPQRLN